MVPDDSTLSSFIWTFRFFSSFARTIPDCHDSFIFNRLWYRQLWLIIWTSFKPIAMSGNVCFSLARPHPLHWRNLKTNIFLWKRILCFPSTLLRRNLKMQLSPVIGFVSVWGKLGQWSHMVIVTSSFSKICVFKLFSVHTTKRRRFQILLEENISPAWCGDWFILNASVVYDSLESGFTYLDYQSLSSFQFS